MKKSWKGLNIGAGPHWKENYPEYEALDIQDFGQKWVLDVRDLKIGDKIKHSEVNKEGVVNWSFKECPSAFSYDEIKANHFLEHLNREEIIQFLKDCWVLLKNKGILKIVVPSLHKDKAWTLTHQTFFTEETFKTLEYSELKTELELPNWKIKDIVSNGRLDICCILKKE